MNKKDDMDYLNQYFNLVLFLRGEVRYLEQIKAHIIENYVTNRRVLLIRPTYSKDTFTVISEPEWRIFKKAAKSLKAGDTRIQGFYFGCVLRGKMKELEEIKQYIEENYASLKLVRLVKAMYTREKTYIVEMSKWKTYQKLQGMTIKQVMGGKKSELLYH